MKRTLLLASAVFLSLTALTTFISCGTDDNDDIIVNPDNGNNGNNSGQQDQEIMVTIDANGNADGGHRFTKIDETNFYIDDIKYTARNGDLVVTGYNEAFFKGAANIISVLKYQGRTMNVVGIESEAFKNCAVITSIHIPNSVTVIGPWAFEGCSALTSVTIPNSITSIDYGTFWDCTSLSSIIIPNNVTSIGGAAFDGCTSLSSIIIPNCVTSIGNNAFSGCSNLTSITIPDNLNNIGRYAFNGTAWYDNQPEGLVYIGRVAYKFKGTMPEDTQLTIQENTLGIAGSAFESCTNLISITIPNSLVTIGNYSFAGCRNLTSIIIPISVTTIGQSAFYNCSGLTSINIPNSVTKIEYLTFQGCTSVTSITVPQSVINIDKYAFGDFISLKDFFCYSENVPQTDSDAFYNSLIVHSTLHVPAGSVDAYKAKAPWKSFGTIVAIE